MLSILKMKTRSCTPKAKPQVGEIGKVIRGGEAGRRGARWHKGTFTLDLEG